MSYVKTLSFFLLACSFLGHVQCLPKLYIKNAKLVEGGGKEVVLKGTNWFGFNNGQTNVEGLWAGGTSAASDMGTIIFQLRLLGFNAIRLPFTFSDLQKEVLDKRISCKVLSLEELYKRARSRSVKPTSSVLLSGNVCNVMMPQKGKTMDRFVWTIHEFVRSGMYVIIDYHGMGKESIGEFVDGWVKVWDAVRKYPGFDKIDGRVIIDLYNEPDSAGLKWADMTPLYLDVIKKTGYSLYMVEGTGQSAAYMNWGDGFAVDPKFVKAYSIDDASVFFKTIGAYKDKIIISPHVYCPSISKALKYKGKDLEFRLDNSFGHLIGKYPIVIGEFGINFSDSRDVECMSDFAKWLKRKGIKSWLQWNYAENSADTDDIVTNKFQDLNWKVIDWLRRDFNL